MYIYTYIYNKFEIFNFTLIYKSDFNSQIMKLTNKELNIQGYTAYTDTINIEYNIILNKYKKI